MERLYLTATRFAREYQQNTAIKRYEAEENELGEYHETLDWLLSLVENELKYGVTGPVVLTQVAP